MCPVTSVELQSSNVIIGARGLPTVLSVEFGRASYVASAGATVTTAHSVHVSCFVRLYSALHGTTTTKRPDKYRSITDVRLSDVQVELVRISITALNQQSSHVMLTPSVPWHCRSATPTFRRGTPSWR